MGTLNLVLVKVINVDESGKAKIQLSYHRAKT